jgi:hypothetical protein
MIRRYAPLIAGLLLELVGLSATSRAQTVLPWGGTFPIVRSITDIGHNSNSTGASVAVTLPGAIPAGVTVVVCTTEISTGSSGGSVSDGTNTYSSIVAKALNNVTTNGFGQLWYAPNATAVASGSLTYNKLGSGAKANISAFYVNAVQAASLDTAATNSATGSSASPSVTSGVPIQSGELFVACMTNGAPGATLTQASGWTAPPDSDTGTSSVGVIGGHQTNSGSSALTYSPTTGGQSVVWADFIIALK